MTNVRLFLLILGCVLLFIAAVFPEPDPYPRRFRLLSAGLFCWAISTLPFFTH